MYVTIILLRIIHVCIIQYTGDMSLREEQADSGNKKQHKTCRTTFSPSNNSFRIIKSPSMFQASSCVI